MKLLQLISLFAILGTGSAIAMENTSAGDDGSRGDPLGDDDDFLWDDDDFLWDDEEANGLPNLNPEGPAHVFNPNPLPPTAAAAYVQTNTVHDLEPKLTDSDSPGKKRRRIDKISGAEPGHTAHYDDNEKTAPTHDEALRQHEKPYACRFCQYRAAKASTITRHERTHTGEKPYACKHCGYTSAQASHITEHERTHTGEKPFECKHCDYKAATASNVKAHERTHTGHKPFACRFCDYTAAIASSVKRHIQHKHRDSEEKEEDATGDE